MQEMKLAEFKNKKPPELIAYAESLEVENASVMRKQELMFAILKKLAAQDVEIIGDGDIVTPEHAVEMFHTIPHAQLCVVPDTGHGAMPAETVLRFLEHDIITS